jgi:hypothetical protein
VTRALHDNDIKAASIGKYWLEQRQRLQAKQRLKTGDKWRTVYFDEIGEQWLYKLPLQKRLTS